MYKRYKLIHLQLLLIVTVLVAISCSTQQSVYQKFASETTDIDKLASAAYYDAQTIMDNTLDIFNRYKSYMTIEQKTSCRGFLKSMKLILDKLKTLKGYARINDWNTSSSEFSNLRRQLILEAAKYIEGN